MKANDQRAGGHVNALLQHARAHQQLAFARGELVHRTHLQSHRHSQPCTQHVAASLGDLAVANEHGGTEGLEAAHCTQQAGKHQAMSLLLAEHESSEIAGLGTSCARLELVHQGVLAQGHHLLQVRLATQHLGHKSDEFVVLSARVSDNAASRNAASREHSQISAGRAPRSA